MSVEAFNRSTEHYRPEAKNQAIEIASEAAIKLRTLIAEIEQRLGAERASISVDSAMVVHELEKRLRELTKQLEETLAFLEEFDPILYQRLKDNS